MTSPCESSSSVRPILRVQWTLMREGGGVAARVVRVVAERLGQICLRAHLRLRAAVVTSPDLVHDNAQVVASCDRVLVVRLDLALLGVLPILAIDVALARRVVKIALLQRALLLRADVAMMVLMMCSRVLPKPYTWPLSQWLPRVPLPYSLRTVLRQE